MKTKKEEEDDQPVDLQIQLESLRTEHELLKHAFDDLDQDYKNISKENERLKKQARPANKPQEKDKKEGKIFETTGEGAAALAEAKEEMYEFLMKFRYRNEIKQAVYNLANSKEFYWLLQKYQPKPEEVPA